MAERVFLVKALHRSYVNCPISVKLDSSRELDGPVEITEIETGQMMPIQLVEENDGIRAHWIIPSLAWGETKRYLIRPAARPAENAVLLAKSDDDRVVVTIRDSLFTQYHYGSRWARPFLHPLNGPTGSPVTRRYPMEQVEGETHDHIHHKGCYVAWGDVNGTDNWSETPNHGFVRHQSFLAIESGPVLGRLLVLNHWVTKDERKLMEELREYRFYNLPADSRSFDLRVTFRATEGKVRFGDTKEGGICSVRVATSMDAKDKGRIENSYGGINESETWGKRAHWCDYSGPVDGQIVGLAIMDHPSNFRHPTYWHVRNYGLMTANPFGLSHFHNDKSRDGSYELPAGGELTFRYRVLIHRGDAKAGRVAEEYQNYIAPPMIEMK